MKDERGVKLRDESDVLNVRQSVCADAEQTTIVVRPVYVTAEQMERHRAARQMKLWLNQAVVRLREIRWRCEEFGLPADYDEALLQLDSLNQQVRRLDDGTTL